MHVSPETASSITSAVGAALVGACSIPSLSALSKRLFSRHDHGYQEIDHIYQDEDGTATEESQKQHTAFLPRLLALALALMGFVLSIMYAILVTGKWSAHGSIVYSWVTVGTWAFLAIQAVITFIERDSLARFSFGLVAALSCLIALFAVFLEHQVAIFRQVKPGYLLETLAWIQAAFLLAALLSFLSIQRRPEVFKTGRRIDGQFTSNFLSRLTFSWAAPMLTYARKNKNLELEELPALSDYQRCSSTEATFNKLDDGGRLWRLLSRQFFVPFMKQAVISGLSSCLQLGPQFAMFKLLEFIEYRSADTPATEAWLWTFALGVMMVLNALLESWLFFVVYADLGVPVRNLLSILVFSKATRRKDVKGTSKKKEQTELEAQIIAAQTQPSHQQADTNGTKAVSQDAAKEGQEGDEDDEDDAGAKSKQSTVNLVGVDAKRIADFSSFIYLYPSVVIKLVVSMVFLGKLIGARALFAGLAAFAVSMPFNIMISKYYNKAQGKLMTLRDSKVAVINEALQGIRQIKFSAIEQQWQEKIEAKRRDELKVQWRVFKLDTGLVSLWIFGPVMLSAVCLMTYTLIYGELSPSVAFTTIAVLAQIEFVLAILPELTTEMLDAWVACNRIEKYLRAPEREITSIPSETVKFEDATVAWPADSQEEDSDRFILKDLNLEFPRKELSVISGKTGTGKSLLLAACIGEIDKLAGKIYAPKSLSVADRFDDRANPVNWILDTSVAFVAQIPWIENATIRNNILFGLPYDQGRYRKVLSACALEKDLEILPDGDKTDIGANGINLSGGQRWRVSFARAMYSRAGVLVLDDIFSAVDAHVGRHLFEEALTGELGKGRTRILVTHHVGLCLPRTKYSVHLGEGTVLHAGFVEDLRKRGELAEILKEEEEEARKAKLQAEQEAEELATEHANGHLNVDGAADGGALTKVASRCSVRSAKIDDGEVDTKGKAQPKKFTEDEKRETGGIKLDVYWSYISSSGGMWLWALLMLVYLSNSAFSMGRSYWVTIWTRSYRTQVSIMGPNHLSLLQVPATYHINRTETTFATEASSSEPIWYWLGVYLGLSFVVWFFGTLKYFMCYLASIKASYKLFAEMNYTILRTPLRWLDTVPIGRVLNRFSSDFNTIDSRLANNMGYFFYQALEMIAITLAGAFSSPLMIPLAMALFCVALLIMRLYLNGAREVKRLESNARSPIFSDFGALLSGVATVRAFDKTFTYLDRMYTKIDAHGSAFYHIWLFNRWMGFRLSVTGTAFAVAVACVIVASPSIDAALAGFALTFALRYSSAIIWTFRGYSNVEMDLNSAERIIEYTRVPVEDQSGNSAPAAWPTSGRLEVDGLVAGYAPDLPPVLKGLTFTVENGQRVGVVGRTGAGKSSLTLALFRFIHQREGTVFIDGLDVSKIKLHDLRSRLAIIPQDPVLFSGTIRSNLDPFDEYSDADLRTALHRVHLVEETGTTSRASIPSTPINARFVEVAAPTGSEQPTFAENKNLFNSLSSKIAEGGLNLSQGQRQLLCLARAIVARPRLMLLDEATSAVDMATDEMIQRSIREEFEGSTLLVIAHRLSTIADFDRILVMSEGRAVEFGSPKELMKLEEGVFRGMVEGSGEREKLEEIILQSDGNEGGRKGGDGNDFGANSATGDASSTTEVAPSDDTGSKTTLFG